MKLGSYFKMMINSLKNSGASINLYTKWNNAGLRMLFTGRHFIPCLG